MFAQLPQAAGGALPDGAGCGRGVAKGTAGASAAAAWSSPWGAMGRHGVYPIAGCYGWLSWKILENPSSSGNDSQKGKHTGGQNYTFLSAFFHCVLEANPRIFSFIFCFLILLFP